MTQKAPPPGPRLEPRAFGILFAVSIVVAVGNTGLMTVLPAIAREIRIADWMASAVFSLSALLWAVMSPIWARESDRRGRKPLIMLGPSSSSSSQPCGQRRCRIASCSRAWAP